ncbi:hypothetical protein Hanom_Chr08g00690631 [Helianthus anomalus]
MIFHNICCTRYKYLVQKTPTVKLNKLRKTVNKNSSLFNHQKYLHLKSKNTMTTNHDDDKEKKHQTTRQIVHKYASNYQRISDGWKFPRASGNASAALRIRVKPI